MPNNQAGKNASILADADKIAKKIAEARIRAEEEIAEIETNNAKRLAKLQHELSDKEAQDKKRRLDQEYKTQEELIKKGYSLQRILGQQSLDERLKELKKEEEEKLKAAARGGKDDKKASDKIKKEYAERRKLEQNLEKEKEKAEKKAQATRLANAKEVAGALYNTPLKTIFGPGKEAREDMKKKLMAEQGISESEANSAIAAAKLEASVSLIGDFAKKLESTMEDVAMTQTAIDTRLQGSRQIDTKLGSYWRQLEWDIGANVGFSPLIKQADVVTNLKTLVGQGIAYNVDQRAFLQTISEKIATTFEATDATLLKLVRIQQADTTAARLGMESALTSFLNSMYETTEYMQGVASDIRSQIYEASALMGAADATAFEYQVQKWMGSLYSVGFSNTSGFAGALGKLAAGDISGISGGGIGNLLVMAATRAGLPIAEMLASGMGDSEVNQLMAAAVQYLADIYNETKDNKVVAQQFANVYGLSASDLKAAANLAPSIAPVSNVYHTYGTLMGQLNTMADSMYQRTSIGEIMHNVFDNLQYSTAASMGANPILYATYNIATMLDQLAGGIALPAISVMGNSVNLRTTVADLMRVASVSGGVLSSIGKLIAGVAGGSGGGFTGSGMLKAFGVTGDLDTLTRGSTAGLLTASGPALSTSGYIGNESGDDVQNKTMSDAADDGNKQLVEAQDESEEVKLSQVDEHIVMIYSLLQRVTEGTASLQVVMKAPTPGLYGGYGPNIGNI